MNTIKLFIAVFLLSFGSLAQAQNSITFKITDEETGEPLIGATVYASATLGAIADNNGIATINNIEGESITVKISFVGYEAIKNTYSIPYQGKMPIEIKMEHHHEEVEEMVVTATRTSRSIEDIPTRIEFLGAEELQEKAVMRSANIAMLLRESTGIQMQVTSPSSANQSIRIQGLDGRYTQLMKDGFPLYGGFSGGLSIMQIPPLDLRQVEVIKGSNSTLYGGGAIAGLVNLVSIRPEEEALTKVMVDQTSAGGTTLNAFYASAENRWSYTLFGSGHRQTAYDANDDNFSDLPETRSITLNPTIFFKPSETDEFRLALNGTFEDRWGGNLNAVDDREPNAQNYLQENESRRMSYQLSYNKTWDENRRLTLKNSLLHFDRGIHQFQYGFDGEQVATFSEATYSFGQARSSWLVGMNIYSDRFNESHDSNSDRSYEQFTAGVFVQQNTQLSEDWSLETGLRLDQSKDYGLQTLPRLSVMYKAHPKLTFRMGGGLGYKLPTIFTEETERLSFRGLQSFNLNNLDAEQSYGGNFDINYITAIGDEWTFSLNQLFYYTQLNDPVVLTGPTVGGAYAFQNANGDLSSKGLETNMKLTYQDFKLFLNYALIDTELGYNNELQKPLTAKHNIGAVLVYEEHGKWRIGLESYYTGKQFRSDYTETDDYWIVGFMALRKFKNISLYLNFENFSDTRQSRFENINLSNAMNPEALEVWAPMDGFIMNGGVILEF
jgi:iron complex outermembrane receptor protein